MAVMYELAGKGEGGIAVVSPKYEGPHAGLRIPVQGTDVQRPQRQVDTSAERGRVKSPMLAMAAILVLMIACAAVALLSLGGGTDACAADVWGTRTERLHAEQAKLEEEQDDILESVVMAIGRGEDYGPYQIVISEYTRKSCAIEIVYEDQITMAAAEAVSGEAVRSAVKAVRAAGRNPAKDGMVLRAAVFFLARDVAGVLPVNPYGKSVYFPETDGVTWEKGAVPPSRLMRRMFFDTLP